MCLNNPVVNSVKLLIKTNGGFDICQIHRLFSNAKIIIIKIKKHPTYRIVEVIQNMFLNINERFKRAILLF